MRNIRAQELRVEEFSDQKLRESNETIQRLTSQLQDLQEQMNSVNDSGECQEVESNHSGRLSYVSTQPASIPSSRSLLSRDKSCHLAQGIRLDHRKMFSVINFLQLTRPEIIIKEFISQRHKVRQDGFQCLLVEEILAQEMKI